MPASMIMAEAGGRPNVNGRSMAVVLSGEMPGRTPTSVPMITPRKQKRRFCSESAVEKPRARLSTRFTGGSSPPRPDGQGKPQAVHEQEHCEGREDHGK